MGADNDFAAVKAWLELQAVTATQPAYRNEAERLMLWAIMERSRALSSLRIEDAITYRVMVANSERSAPNLWLPHKRRSRTARSARTSSGGGLQNQLVAVGSLSRAG